MLARFLRVGLVIELLAAVVLARALMLAGLATWLAVVLAALLPLAVHAVPLAIEFVTGALIDRRPLARLGPLAFVRLWWSETRRSFMAFNVDQAWRADYPERPPVRDPRRPAVLFVHGYMCNRGAWRRWMLSGALPAHWNVATVNLEPVFGPVDRYAEELHAAIERLRAATGAERVTLVCHSMGGLVARAYLRRHGSHAVQRVVTICTPHNGTVFARFGHGSNARQMRHACDFVLGLARDPEPVDFVCIASHHDNLIVPRDNQVLECAEAVWFERVGHLAMIEDPAVLRTVIDLVGRPALPVRPVEAAATAG